MGKEGPPECGDSLVVWGRFHVNAATFAVCLAFVGGGIWLGLAGRPLPITVGIICVLFFGACGADALRRIIRSVPALVVDRYGITDFASGLDVGFIPWDEIAEFGQRRCGGLNYIFVSPRKPDMLIARYGFLRRAIMRMDLVAGLSPLMIPTFNLAISADRIESAMHRFIRSKDDPLGLA